MRTETLILGVLAIGLLFVFGLVAPIERVVGTIDSDQEFTIITLNACWLFDGVGEEDFYTAPQCAGEAEEHLIDVADYLATIDADFIAIEEIESADMLHRLNEKLGGQYHEIFVQGTDDHTGQDVAGLSRFPVSTMGRSNDTQHYPIPDSVLRWELKTWPSIFGPQQKSETKASLLSAFTCWPIQTIWSV